MALTGQAPFNRYQFRNILLNGQFTPPVVASGAAAIAESADTASGSGTAVLVKSSLNALGTGPESRFTKFRQSPRGISAQSAAGSAAVTESSDTVTAAGSGITVAPVVSSLNPRNLGPSPTGPFNLNQFKSFVSNSSSNPPAIGSAAIPESSDSVSASGSAGVTGTAAIVESADVVAGIGVPGGSGSGAAVEASDTVAASGSASTAGSAAIAEAHDTAAGTGSASTSGSAAIVEPNDTVNASGNAGGGATGAIVESSDTVTGAGSTSTSGSAAIAESADVASGSGAAGFGAIGAITEQSDTVSGAGSTSTSGAAAITEARDTAAGIGARSGITMGTAAINEIPDTVLGQGSLSTSGSAAILEPSDISTGQAGALSPIAYPARILRTGFMPQGIAGVGILPYGEFFMAVGDVILYGIDWAGWLANYWQRGANVPPGLTIRPRYPNGFQFTTLNGGESGNLEPVWPTIEGETICEGSVLWMCEAIDTTSLTATVQSAAWKTPPGITVDGQVIAGQLVIASLDATQAIAGVDYQVNVPTTMSDGESKTGRFVLKVR